MKKSVFLFLVMIIGLSGIVFQSCENEDSEESVKMTSADALVSSTEFKVYLSDNESFYKKVHKVYAMMPEKEKKEMDEIFVKIGETEDVQLVFSLAENLKSISGIDFIAFAKKSSETAQKVFAGYDDVNSREFAKAMRKCEIGKNG